MGYLTTILAGVALGAVAVAPAQAAEKYFVYVPKQVSEPPAKGNGVVVREIVIQKGDTLSKLAEQHIGKSSYYAQILVFNKIKDPNKIYAGRKLRIPVNETVQHGPLKQPQAAAPAAAPAAAAPAPAATPAPVQQAAPAPPPAPAKAAAPQPAPVKVSAKERQEFDQALKLYRAGKYEQAVGLFERFLASHPASPLAPDAALYKAGCYEKMAGL